MLSIRIEQPRRSFTVRVNLEVAEGQVYCLFGPSGAGKTTVLSVTGGFESLHQGRITLDGTVLAEREEDRRLDLPAWRRQLGYLSQTTHLFPHLDVAHNITFALPKGRIDGYTRSLILALDLQDYLSANVNTLSGGQKQRVALARALAARPRVLLLDEPFSALDQLARQDMQELLLRLQRQLRLTVLMVTHQLTEAQRLSHTIGVLDEGHILQEAAPAGLIDAPASVKVALLTGYKTILPAAEFGLGEGVVALHPDRVLPGAFPELGPVSHGTLESCCPYDGRWRLGLRLSEDQTLEATATDSMASRVGEEMPFTLLSPPVLPDVPGPVSSSAALTPLVKGSHRAKILAISSLWGLKRR